MVPVDGTSLWTKGIIHLYTRWIILAWGPDMRQATLRPGLERQQQVLLRQFTVLLGLWTETRPDANHEVGMLLVYVLNHLWTINKIL